MLAEPIRELVGKVQSADEAARAAAPGEQMIEVSSIIAKAASFYEKLRYLVDYREEHTIRRAALERILKRRVFLERKAGSCYRRDSAEVPRAFKTRRRERERGQAPHQFCSDRDRRAYIPGRIYDRPRKHGGA